MSASDPGSYRSRGPRNRHRNDAIAKSTPRSSRRGTGIGVAVSATADAESMDVGGAVGTGGSVATLPAVGGLGVAPAGGRGVAAARGTGVAFGVGAGAECSGSQLANDRARLDAAVLVLVPGTVQLKRPHVPRRARNFAR